MCFNLSLSNSPSPPWWHQTCLHQQRYPFFSLGHIPRPATRPDLIISPNPMQYRRGQLTRINGKARQRALKLAYQHTGTKSLWYYSALINSIFAFILPFELLPSFHFRVMSFISDRFSRKSFWDYREISWNIISWTLELQLELPEPCQIFLPV